MMKGRVELRWRNRMRKYMQRNPEIAAARKPRVYAGHWAEVIASAGSLSAS